MNLALCFNLLLLLDVVFLLSCQCWVCWVVVLFACAVWVVLLICSLLSIASLLLLPAFFFFFLYIFLCCFVWFYFEWKGAETLHLRNNTIAVRMLLPETFFLFIKKWKTKKLQQQHNNLNLVLLHLLFFFFFLSIWFCSRITGITIFFEFLTRLSGIV